MRDVAAAAGVHHTTVSLALRHDRRITDATREHIVRVAGQLGYKLHPLLSAYASARRARQTPASISGTTLAFIMRADCKEDARQEHFRGAQAAAEAQGYSLEPFVVGQAGLSPARLNTILITRNIHGLIIAPLPEAHGHFQLDWQEFSSVIIEYTFTDPALDRVVHDSYAGMRLALAKCRERGCWRVGLVLTKTGYERTEGLNDAAFWKEQKSEDKPFAAISPLHLGQWDDLLFMAWFLKYKPDAIITSRHCILGAQAVLEKQGVSIPSDVSLINLNFLPPSPFSGIDQSNHELGATASRMVIDKLNRNDRGVPAVRQTVLIPGQWVEGQTLKRQKMGTTRAKPSAIG